MQGPHDVAHDPVLQIEDLRALRLVPSRAELRSAFRVAQRHRDPQAAVGLSHAALHHVARAKFVANLPRRRRAPLESLHGVERHHPHSGKAAERVDDVLGDPVAEVLAPRIAAQVGEGQNRYGRHRRRGRGPAAVGGNGPGHLRQAHENGNGHGERRGTRGDPGQWHAQRPPIPLLRRVGDAGRGNGRDQPIAALRDGLDVARRVGIVAQRLAQLDDRLRERVVSDHDTRPDVREQLLAPHHLAGPRRELDEHLGHLEFEAHHFGAPAQFIAAGVQAPFPHLEVLRGWRIGPVRHGMEAPVWRLSH